MPSMGVKPENTSCCLHDGLPGGDHHQGACTGFYKGRIANAIVAALDEEKGVMTLDDLAHHRSTVTRPIHTTYRGHTIYEVPPPTQVS